MLGHQAAAIYRCLLTLVLAFLLLGMQQEAHLHALTHFAEWLHGPQDPGLQRPESDEACVECLLLAGAANAAPVDSASLPQALGQFVVFHAAAAIRPADACSYYSSRAPPPPL